MIKALVTFLIVFTSSALLGQKYSFVTYSTEQGLPQSQVTAICQDDKDYLWVGTIGGLAKFGGNKFTTYSSTDGLLNNRITSLEFFDETIWVGHDGGISLIKHGNIENVSYTGTGNERSRNVSKIIQFQERILVCSNGGGLFEKVKDKLVRLKLENEDFEQIRDAHVYKGVLYLATKGGVLVTTDLKYFRKLEGLNDGSFSGVTGYGDKLVFSTFNSGLFIRDMKSNKQDFIDPVQLKYSVSGCYLDRANQIWLTTLDGIIKIDSNQKLFFFDESNGMPVNMISCIFNDKTGNIWIGSQAKGVFRFPTSDFKYYDQTTGFPTDLFLSGFEDQKGDYYFGTFDKGIVKKSRSGQISVIPSRDLTIWSALANCDNKHWFGSSSSLISMDQNGKLTYYTEENEPNIPGSKITTLYKLSESSMLIGGNDGVAIYEAGKFKRLGSGENRDIGTVRDFGILNDTLFCASNLGLFAYVKGQFIPVPNTSKLIYSIEANENTLWFGTESGLFSYRNGKIKKIELFQDLGSNFNNFLNFRNNKLYVGTNNGLFIVSNLNSAAPTYERFGIGDGIIDIETNLNSSFFDSKGNFWFGTASGLVCYHPDFDYKKKSKPKVHLLSVLLNYEPFEYGKYSKDLSNEGLPMHLNLPNSKNNLIFEFDGVSLAHQKGIGYQYFLEGLRESWSTITDNPTISFTNLPAGDYLLRVRAVDVDGEVSDEIQIPFVINQAFYKTWWFIALEILALIGIVITIFRYRIRRLAELNEKERMEYQARLLSLEQKSMNASMNRHFIFNSLNSIQYFINTQDKLAANKYLTNFAQLIRKNLDSATAVGNVISLEEELDRLKLYLSLESMRFKDRFEYEININDVDIESVQIPPMIMQPFVENSIIHGILPMENVKGLIKIDLFIKEGYLHISIEDNGVGFQESLKNKQYKYGDHRSQGMEITSKRIELIQQNSPNDISLIGPEQITDSNGLINGTRVLIKIPVFDLENN